MRVLVTSTPGTGHIHPIVPLATALRAAGHDMLWATSPESCGRVESYGFRTTPAGINTPERRALFAQNTPDIFALPPRERRLAMMPGLFGYAAAPRMRDDLVAIVDDFRPDVIVHDLAEFAAPPVATSRGIPHVTAAFSGALSDALHDAVVESVAAVWAAEGLSVPEHAGLYDHLYLHPFPAGLGTTPASDRVELMRPLGFDGAATSERPEWVSTLGADRPLVYATFGTELALAPLWNPVLDALGTADVDAVATIGSKLDRSALGATADNVRVEQYVPQSFLLDRARLVVSHSGAGTALEAVARAIPQLCVPIGADQWENADALAASGGGIVVEPDQRDPDTIRAMLHRLLDEPGFRASATHLAEEIRVMPHPREHVATIEALV